MTKTLLKTSRFSVESREIEHPNGKTSSREFVVHPGAVVILPMLDENRIVMVRSFRHAINQELWELPAGTREADEEPIETASRELIEETGYRAGTMSPLASFFTSPGFTTELMHAFLATDLTRVGQRLDPEERIVAEICNSSKARRMLADAGFQDAKTLAVLGIYFASQKP